MDWYPSYAKTGDDSVQSVGQWSSVLVLIFFVLSNIAVIVPVGIPVPQSVTTHAAKLLTNARLILPTNKPLKQRRFRLNLITVPLFSVLLLLAAGAIDGQILRKGIVGADGIKPLDIMALFISLAYMAISLDFTGLLRFSAFWVARKGGRSGRRLYLFLYAFFLLCGVIVGNDPVILSGTAFLAYFTRVTGVTPPTAWIFSQFTAANIASVVLVSSNPTNLVLSGAFDISFIQYTAHVILPFIAAAVAVYPVLRYVLYNSDTLIPKQLHGEFNTVEESGATLIDKHGAIFGGLLLLITLAVLVGTSTVDVPVWQVTVPPAIILLLRDGIHDWRSHMTTGSPYQGNAHAPAAGENEYPMAELQEGNSNTTADVSRSDLWPPPSPPLSETRTPPREALFTRLNRWESAVSMRFPTVTTIACRLPVSLIPFAFLMFILVQALSAKGWVEVLARWWAAWVERTGTLGAIGGMAFVSCIMCNICGTNIGATILLARILQVWTSSVDVDARTREGTIYALALGSNYGAFSLTFSASLAGLLWRQILRQKGIHVRARQFLLLNLPTIFVAMLASTGILAAQEYVLHKNRT